MTATEPTKPGAWMTEERLDHLFRQTKGSITEDELQELIRELARVRRGASLLMRVDGVASQRIPGYVESPLAKEAKHWLYD